MWKFTEVQTIQLIVVQKSFDVRRSTRKPNHSESCEYTRKAFVELTYVNFMRHFRSTTFDTYIPIREKHTFVQSFS